MIGRVHLSISEPKWHWIVKELKMAGLPKPAGYLGEEKGYALPINQKPYPRYHIITRKSKKTYKRGKKVYLSIHIDWVKHTSSTDKDFLINKLVKRLATMPYKLNKDKE